VSCLVSVSFVNWGIQWIHVFGIFWCMDPLCHFLCFEFIITFIITESVRDSWTFFLFSLFWNWRIDVLFRLTWISCCCSSSSAIDFWFYTKDIGSQQEPSMSAIRKWL
jgi:hypothetical protein